MSFRRRGFTLVEVLVASTIGAFIALVAVGALNAVSTSAELVDKSLSASAEVRFASKMISRDLENLYRDKDVSKMKLCGMIVAPEGGGQYSDLTFYTVGRTQARQGQPEGDVYEVEYLLKKKDDKSVLMRRLWPNPDKDAEPGGVLTVIAEDIEVFQVRFFDGEEWQTEWPEDMEAIAGMVEISIVGSAWQGKRGPAENMLVSFARSAWGRVGPESGESDSERGEGGNEESNGR